jgi:cytochrome c peroxidase
VIDSDQVKSAISQFLFTLLSHGSKFDRVMKHETEFTMEEFRGFGLVNNQTRGDCLHCHPTDGRGLMTTFGFSNNGLDSIMNAEKYPDKGRGGQSGNSKDNGKFKIPSLRNIALTAPYMHDGRFKTLEEVVEFYSSGVHICANIDPKMQFAYKHGSGLNDKEKKDIVAFLKTLTDSVFIRDKAFSDPFKNN